MPGASMAKPSTPSNDQETSAGMAPPPSSMSEAMARLLDVADAIDENCSEWGAREIRAVVRALPSLSQRPN